MLRFLCCFLLLSVHGSEAFHAGFRDWTLSVQSKDTTHYRITICALCRVMIDYLQSEYGNAATYLNSIFNETNGQCQNDIVKLIVDSFKIHPQFGIDPWLFQDTLERIASSNSKTDLTEQLKEESHFDSESFRKGSQLALKRYQLATDYVKIDDNFDQARKAFGQLLHTLQDFYSHSNYIELDYTSPNTVLGRDIFKPGQIASSSDQTCVSCRGSECQTIPNLSENIRKKKLLTSGYFSVNVFGFYKKKPKGKCSHGGALDGTSNDEPTGGINKDTLDSAHGHLHYKAAHVAYLATVEILKNFQKDIGNKAFAIDMECSIADYIELSKQISTNIVNQYGAVEFAPHNYILITFDSNAAEIKVNSGDPRNLTAAIERLKPCSSSGSSKGNMYYHGLIEALKKCQTSSVIYTFTDSPARDGYIKHQARALLRNKGVVIYSFMGKRMKMRSLRVHADLYDSLDGSDGDIDLATITGGLTYPVANADRTVISEFILRRLAWTKLQSLVLLRSNSSSASFFVDSSIEELYLDVSSMGEIKDIGQMQLRKPNSALFSLNTSRINTNHLYMWKIVKPDVGQWSLTIPQLANGYVQNVQVEGKTSIMCSSTMQKELNSNTSDSSGYAQLTTEPIVNSNLIILTICQNVNSTGANVSLISQSGRIIQSYAPASSSNNEILTKIRVPAEQFRIQAVVTLRDGTKVQRTEKQLISPTLFSIEILNQPFVASTGETIRMNYTITTAVTKPVKLRLQITDTLNLITNEAIEKNLTFTGKISDTQTLTIPKQLKQRVPVDIVTFALSTYDNRTSKFVYENDETASVYFDVVSASNLRALNYLMAFFIILIYTV